MREWKQAREQYRFAEFKRLRQMSKKQQQKLEIDSVTYLHSSNRSPSFMYSFANPLLYSRFSGLARGAQGDKVYFAKGRTNLREDRGLDIIGTVAAASDRSDSQAPKGPALILIKTRERKRAYIFWCCCLLYYYPVGRRVAFLLWIQHSSWNFLDIWLMTLNEV